MKRSFRFSAVSVVAVLSLGLVASPVEAKPEFAAREKAPCATCHAPYPPTNNEVGKCYKRNDHKNLPACKADPSK